MWLKLASATFTTNLGKMSDLSNSISIKYSASGFSYTTGSVSKDAASASLILTLNSNYTYEHNNNNVTVTGATKGTISYSNGTLTISITPSSGSTFGDSGVSSINVTVTGATSTGGVPEAPTNYTFTLTPDPISATVTLSATGYSTVSGTGSKSITVANGTKVNWSVSADGYIEQAGSWTISDGDKSENIILVASSESGEPYWVGEKLSGKAHGTGTASSYLQTQYYYITDEAAISELSGRTVDKMAFNFANKSGANTPAGKITVYLVNPNNSTPSNWEAKAEITVEAYPASSQKEFDITPFTVPAGYTVGYRASKSSILGGGFMMQDYKFGGAFYEDADAASKDAQLGGVDIHIQGA